MQNIYLDKGKRHLKTNYYVAEIKRKEKYTEYKDFPEIFEVNLRIYSQHNYMLDLRCTQQHIVLHNRNTT